MEFTTFTVHPHFLKSSKKNRKLKKEAEKYPSELLNYKKGLERLRIIENEITLQCHEEEREIQEASVEDCNVVKASIRDSAIKKIDATFLRAEKKILHYEEFHVSKLKCSEALQVRLMLHNHIMFCYETAVKRISYLFENYNYHRGICEKLLELMMVQALTWFHEPYVIIRVTSRDLQVAQRVLSKAQKRAHDILKRKIVVILDTTTFLPLSCYGGIQGQNKQGTIIIKNTFNERTRIVVTKYLPLLKRILFRDTKYVSKLT